MDWNKLITGGIIIQGLLTLGIWGAIIYLAVTGQGVPDIVGAGGMTIIGFFFGEVVTVRTMRALSK